MHRSQQPIRIGYTKLVLQLVLTMYGPSFTFLELIFPCRKVSPKLPDSALKRLIIILVGNKKYFISIPSRLESSYNFILAWSLHQHCLFSHRVSTLVFHACRALGLILVASAFASVFANITTQGD